MREMNGPYYRKPEFDNSHELYTLPWLSVAPREACICIIIIRGKHEETSQIIGAEDPISGIVFIEIVKLADSVGNKSNKSQHSYTLISLYVVITLYSLYWREEN